MVHNEPLPFLLERWAPGARNSLALDPGSSSLSKDTEDGAWPVAGGFSTPHLISPSAGRVLRDQMVLSAQAEGDGDTRS